MVKRTTTQIFWGKMGALNSNYRSGLQSVLNIFFKVHEIMQLLCKPLVNQSFEWYNHYIGHTIYK